MLIYASGRKVCTHATCIECDEEGPYAFTIRCKECGPDTESHRPGCAGIVGYGLKVDDRRVAVLFMDGRTQTFATCEDAYRHFEFETDLSVDFRWGPSNPDGSTVFW